MCFYESSIFFMWQRPFFGVISRFTQPPEIYIRSLGVLCRHFKPLLGLMYWPSPLESPDTKASPAVQDLNYNSLFCPPPQAQWRVLRGSSAAPAPTAASPNAGSAMANATALTGAMNWPPPAVVNSRMIRTNLNKSPKNCGHIVGIFCALNRR